MNLVRTSGLSLALPASPGLLLLLVSALAATAAQAQRGPGDLLIAPTRVVLEGRQRTAEVTLVNVGAAAATFRISLVNLRMDENGGTREIEISGAEPGELFANDLIRYSPRQVTLEPHVAQTVRLQVRKPADLAPGEYRSHLLFRGVPAAEPAAGKGAEPSTEVNIRLTAVYGISIPVIVRQGETAATAALSDLAIVPPAGAEREPTLRFRINRSGSQSVFGDLTATFVPAGGKPRVVGIANGIAVYTPNPMRVAGIVLHLPPDVALKNGLLNLTYRKQEKGKETLAEAAVRVP
jgi:P pilus assembly chaperone PapD